MKEAGRTLGAVLACGLLLGSLLACKDEGSSAPAPTEPTEIPRVTSFKKLAPKAKTLLATLRTLDGKAKSEPPVAKDEPLSAALDRAQVAIVGDKWLADVQRSAQSDEIDLQNTTLSLCASAVDKRPEATKDSELDSDNGYLEECTAWKYVAVVRVRQVKAPKVDTAAKTFTPGEVAGDVLVFPATSSEVVARYRFRTTNSDQITVVEGKPEAEWVADAHEDLADNLVGVIAERLARERDSMGE